jgi:hypothetical protein
MRLIELELPKRKIRQIEKINNRKEYILDNGPSYKQLLFKIAFIELNKINTNTLKHLTTLACVGNY